MRWTRPDGGPSGRRRRRQPHGAAGHRNVCYSSERCSSVVPVESSGRGMC
jgi:hypothetical protein